MQENCMCKLRRKATKARVHVLKVTTINEDKTIKKIKKRRDATSTQAIS
jgi:hypothetical protein